MKEGRMENGKKEGRREERREAGKDGVKKTEYISI